jgi:hypothetical protein
MARAEGEELQGVAMDVRDAGALEFYIPVPAHAAAWRGDDRILVATEVNDHEAPVAFDVRGDRVVLDPKDPPAIPVLAVVPQETDFEAPNGPRKATCTTCEVEDPPPPPPPYPNPVAPSLRMTYFYATEDFEGWLRGDPEFEVHVMGPASVTDTIRYRTMYCIGEHGDRYWDLNSTRWTGDVVLMSPEQLSAFHTTFPNNNYSIMAVEDDDTACEIKVDRDLMAGLISAIDRTWSDYKAARDSIGLNGKTVQAVKSGWDLLSAIATFFKTNDEVVGVAVANSITGYYSELGNWSWIGGGLSRHGWVKLELR